jgi:hypothetical protein
MVIENRMLTCLALILTLICTACNGLGNPSSTSATNKYDGTYDWISPTVNGQNTRCSACVFINSGIISSINSGEGELSGVASDNITFTGPCPTGATDTSGNYSGSLGGANPYQWQGTWTCTNGLVGGGTSVWKLYNQRSSSQKRTIRQAGYQPLSHN